MIKERDNFWMDFRAALAVATGKQIGFGEPPTAAELGAEGTALTVPYAIIYPITESEGESSMDDANDSEDLVVQITMVGSSPRQATAMSNKVKVAMLDMTPGGAYVHALFHEDDKVEWRLRDSRGAILPSGVNTFNRVDSYRIRRGA